MASARFSRSARTRSTTSSARTWRINPRSSSWQEATAKRSCAGLSDTAGAVRVRPMGLVSPFAVKRYQYQRPGAKPWASTWTEWARSARAIAVPRRTTRIGRETRPQHDAVRQRLARGDAERKEIIGARAVRSRHAWIGGGDGLAARDGERRRARACGEEFAAIERWAGLAVLHAGIFWRLAGSP